MYIHQIIIQNRAIQLRNFVFYGKLTSAETGSGKVIITELIHLLRQPCKIQQNYASLHALL